jgi:hypothetical protein
MNKIFKEISELSKEFKTMCFGLTQNETDIDNAVQELMVYFLERPELVKKIYDKDGLLGITKYGAVVLRRSLTSVRSPFYYKYKKYYTNLAGVKMSNTKKDNFHKSIYNIPEEVVENIGFKNLDKIDIVLGDMYWYDRKVFELYYYENNTLDSLAKKTGISRNSLYTTIDKVRTYIKDALNE